MARKSNGGISNRHGLRADAEGVAGAGMQIGGATLVGSGTVIANAMATATQTGTSLNDSGNTTVYVNQSITEGNFKDVLTQDVVSKHGANTVCNVYYNTGGGHYVFVKTIAEYAGTAPQTVTYNGESETITTQQVLLGTTPSGNGAVMDVKDTAPYTHQFLVPLYPFISAHLQEVTILGIAIMAVGATLFVDYIRRKKVERLMRRAEELHTRMQNNVPARWA